MRLGWRMMLVWLAAIAMVAAACGGSDAASESASDESADDVRAETSEDSGDEDEADGEGSGDGETVEAGDDTDTGDGDGESWETYESPIGSFLGAPSFAPDEDSDDQFIEMERQVQQMVVECMTAQGFEYYPEDPEQFIGFDGGLDDDWGSEEWAATWGFGITTMAFGQSQVGPDLLGYPDDDIFPADDGQQTEDPNQVYVSSLSEGEIEAYYAALWGEQPEFDETATQEEIDAYFEDYVPTGCYPEAQEEIFAAEFGGGEAMVSFEEEFGDQLEQIYERVEADPRIEERRQAVDACLIDAGQQPLPENGDVWLLFEDDLNALQDEVWGAFDEQFFDEEGGEIAEDVGGVTETDEEGGDPFEYVQPELNDDQKQRLGALQEAELALAAAVTECGGSVFGSFGGGDEIYFEVLAEYEQQFLDDNAAALEQYRGAFNG